MTSLAAVREALMAQANGLLTRTGMYAGTGREVDLTYLHLANLLDLIDGRDGRAEEAVRHAHGKLGLTGPFEAMFGDETTYIAEATSVVAQLFAMSGRFAPERAVPAEDWAGWVDGLRERFEDQDVHRSLVLAQFGEPSFSVAISDRGWHTVTDGYMRGGDPASWVFFDSWEREPAISYTEDHRDHVYDPWLRDVRHPAHLWEEGLVLTGFGKFQRWGHGWSLYHAASDAAREEDIDDALRAINASDPSQSLKPR